MDVIEARVIGGAGTGKTTMMIQILEKALSRPEVAGNPFALGFSSFTRAARAEAAGRAGAAWNFNPSDLERQGWFRTVHSVAYKQLGISKGEVLSGSKDDDKWVSEALGADVSYSLDEDGGVGIYLGDPVAAAALNYWSLSRSLLVPLKGVVEADQSPDAPSASEVIRRIEQYEAAKRLDHRMDFTDMLCRFAGVANDPAEGPEFVAPDGAVPDTVVGWIFDEAQDASALLDRACRRLLTGDAVKWAWCVGDPWQVLYSWAGASSSHFMSWNVGKNQKIMPKSYRCAAPIFALGERCIKGLPDYWDRGIEPADHDGEIVESDNFEDDLQDLDPTKETLVLARTNRNVDKIAAILDDVGMPFRKVKAKQGALNRDSGMGGLWRLQHGEAITGEEWGHIIQMLPSKSMDGRTWLVRGSKARWSKGLCDNFDRIYPEDLPAIGATEHLQAAIGSGEWSGLPDGGTKWAAAAKRWGVDAVSAPKIRIGTVHCSPPDEPVLTDSGYVPIADLDPAKHRLCSASDASGLWLTWGGKGRICRGNYLFPFLSARRHYDGRLLVVKSEKSVTRVTPCHRMAVRVSRNFYDKWVVYLMRKGEWWRIGFSTSATIPYMAGGVGGRLATEEADCCWILGVHETEQAARKSEMLLQATYGIPGLCFRRTRGTNAAAETTVLESVHAAATPFVYPRAKALLADFGLLEDYPLRRRENSVYFGRMFETAAANLIPGYMELPVVPDGFQFGVGRTQPQWLPFSVESIDYSGYVHSLEVLPHHYYVSGGAVVHNSAKGMEADKVVYLTSIGRRIKESEENDPEKWAEERRIEYVAVTRARRELVIAHDPRERFRSDLPL